LIVSPAGKLLYHTFISVGCNAFYIIFLGKIYFVISGGKAFQKGSFLRAAILN
jgi:hypothetical protein